MIQAKERVLCAWLAMEEYQHVWDNATAEKLMAEGSIVVNRDGMAYCLRDGILYFTRLKMDGYDWLEHTSVHDDEAMLPPDDHWMDIDPPEGFDSLLPEKVSPSMVRTREPEANVVYRDNGDILERIADSLDLISKCLAVKVMKDAGGIVPQTIAEVVYAMDEIKPPTDY